MKTRLPLAILLITQLLGGGLAQQPTPTPTPSPTNQERPQPPEAEDVVRITTNLVQVDAVITDKNGKLVTDLKPEEVEIYENGREQKITNFSFNLSESTSTARDAKPTAADKNAPAPPPSRLRTEDIRRTIALVVDDLGLSFESTHYVRRALKKFVDEQMQPGDLVAIIRTAGGVGALQQFTTDKRQLYAAIDRVKFYMNGRAGIGAFAPIQPATPGERGEEVDAANEELNQFREDVFSVGTLGAVNYVVRGLRELPGRKSILLISDGFRIHSRDDPTRNYRTAQRLQRLVDEAGRASVVIYTMNATGLQTLGLTAADNTSGRDLEQMQAALNSRRNTAFEAQEGLEVLAHQTGGIAIKNSNDLSGGIRRVLEDQKGYYLIGYRPDQSTFNPRTGRRQFHRLSLKIKRPGKFNVRMRQGFLGVTDEEQPKPRTTAQQLLSALMSPFGATGVHLRLTSLFGNDAQGGLVHALASTYRRERSDLYERGRRPLQDNDRRRGNHVRRQRRSHRSAGKDVSDESERKRAQADLARRGGVLRHRAHQETRRVPVADVASRFGERAHRLGESIHRGAGYQEKAACPFRYSPSGAKPRSDLAARWPRLQVRAAKRATPRPAPRCGNSNPE